MHDFARRAMFGRALARSVIPRHCLANDAAQSLGFALTGERQYPRAYDALFDDKWQHDDAAMTTRSTHHNFTQNVRMRMRR
ncbi:hypothetical protein [Paraburkholderia pallida]|uniref:Uncharacterized protein n=1 Tax=Paraburkholderia pallida TaxID=2547399 RepID=A0A4P7CKN7_9BURK|nr:hypothetical protein [Paraburkholderia pallida]QBQ96248.1 hypothetical protein E1956_03050 [Paraburkholderia pallida]